MLGNITKWFKNKASDEGNFTEWVKVDFRVPIGIKEGDGYVFRKFDVYERKNLDTGECHIRKIECTPMSSLDKKLLGIT